MDERRTNPSPSNTASTIPAVKDEQLSWLMSRGTEMLRVMIGSLSMIMSMPLRSDYQNELEESIRVNTHSSSFSTLFSIASAGFPKTAFQTLVWMFMSAGRNRISRFGALEADSVRHTINSRTRVPSR